MQFIIVQCSAVQCIGVEGNAVFWCGGQCSAVQYSIGQYSAVKLASVAEMQCSAVKILFQNSGHTKNTHIDIATYRLKES